jgi:hypothetical protein
MSRRARVNGAERIRVRHNAPIHAAAAERPAMPRDTIRRSGAMGWLSEVFMATSARQDREFIDMALEFLRNDGLLEKAIAWIAGNMNPEDVFPVRDLETWADDNGYVQDPEPAS